MNENIVLSISGMGFVLFILTLLTVIVVAVIKNFRTKAAVMAEIARDEAYRKLAEESASAQQKMAQDLQEISHELSELKASIKAVEKMLNEVG